MTKLLLSLIATATGLVMASCTIIPESPFVDGVTEALDNEGKVNVELLEWIREPEGFTINCDSGRC